MKKTKGVFETAHGGTIFLDEIGELPPHAQAVLLRVLEMKRHARVGSSEEIAVDVRIVAATHRDLEAMCKEGKFRDDLYYRLNAMIIHVPPLRERPEDVIPLAHHFLDLANKTNEAPISGFDPDALELLCAHSWPGNVRELRNTVDRAVAIAQGGSISASDLPDRVRSVAQAEAESPRNAPLIVGGSLAVSKKEDPEPEDYKAHMQRVEKDFLLEVLRASEGNQAEAARRLKIARRTLVDRIQRLGIKRSW